MTGDIRAQLQQALGAAYTLDRELGGGGMSRVFVATEHALGRQVVVKVLPAEMAGQVSVERFKREIALAARLQHPHIVPLLTAGDAQGLPYFTMPLIAGESLRARLSKHGELPLNEAVRLLREIGAALAYAHEHAIVHRDIKPDNVLLSGGSAMVTDFGVAKALSSSSNAEGGMATSLGVALGTPAYMAPEQASADPNVDHRADIYAFGVLAYELLTGQPPFVGRTPQNLLAAHVTEAPEHVTKRRSTLPPALAALIMRCLEKRASDRPQTANELVHGLDQINTPSGGTHPTNAVPAYATPQPANAAPGSRTRAVVAAVGIVALAAVAGFALLRDGKSGAPRSMAVLPTDIGADTAHTYLADGLSNELTTKLSKIPGLSVRAYSSSRVMRGKGAREAGKELRVASVLTATMSRSGSRLRVTASLINAADENVIWSETFEESDQDQFGLQDKLVAAIAGALKLSLSPETKAAVTARGTTNAEAHELVQRARVLIDEFTDASLRRAVALTETAIRLDSNYADAWAAQASAWGYLADDFVPAREAAPNMRRAAERALALDSSLADAHAQIGAERAFYEADLVAGMAELERALLLDSANVMAGTFYPSYLRLYKNLPDSAARVLARLIRLNPLSFIAWDQAGLSAVDFKAVSGDSAAATCQKARQIHPKLGGKCDAYRALARNDAGGALAGMKVWAGPSPGGRELATIARYMVSAGDTAGSLVTIAKALARSPSEYVREDYVASYYRVLGDRERAIEWIVKAWASGIRHVWMPRQPAWADIRTDPRVARLLSTIRTP
jgi:serine/threonine protein kinase